MKSSPRPFLMFALLLSIGLRTIFGAPCCMDMAQAAEVSSENSQHAEHHDHAEPSGEADGHADHGDGDPTAKPCCSACGPTLPTEAAVFTKRTVLREMPLPDPIRALAKRPPFPAYDATGPPLLI